MIIGFDEITASNDSGCRIKLHSSYQSLWIVIAQAFPKKFPVSPIPSPLLPSNELGTKLRDHHQLGKTWTWGISIVLGSCIRYKRPPSIIYKCRYLSVECCRNWMIPFCLLAFKSKRGYRYHHNGGHIHILDTHRVSAAAAIRKRILEGRYVWYFNMISWQVKLLLQWPSSFFACSNLFLRCMEKSARILGLCWSQCLLI